MNSDLERVRQALRSEVTGQPQTVAKRWSHEALTLISLNLALATGIAIVWSRALNEQLALRWSSACLLSSIIALASIAAVIPHARGLRQAALFASVLGILVLCGLGGFGSAIHVYCESPSCAPGELAISLLPGIATILILRRFAYQPKRAVAGGLAAGATGLLALDLTCALRNVAHVALFHVLPCAFVILAIAEVRRRLPSRTHVP
jgi:hypothetical protein